MITITEKKNCNGCHACASICPQDCITMESDYEGFWYPKINMQNCVACDLCEKICPIIYKVQIENEPQAYACYNIDESVRMESSSGGLFTLIAEQVIHNNGVVFGARFLKNFTVVHCYIEEKEELRRLRGSKYVQSKIGETYKQARVFLKQGRQVLFSGTPCQIGGLKAYLKQDYANLTCIDIICHGVPSLKVWQKYVSYQENRAGATIQSIAFRRKDEGWKRFSISLSFKNEMEYVQTHDKDLYMQAFLKNICLRPSCYACNFKTLHRQSDITLADFWGIRDILPEMDDDKGTSLAIINSVGGKSMFNRIKYQITYKEVDINKAVSYNSSATKSVERNPKREKFFKEIDEIPFDKLVNKYCSDSIMMRINKRTRCMAHMMLKRLTRVAFTQSNGS